MPLQARADRLVSIHSSAHLPQSNSTCFFYFPFYLQLPCASERWGVMSIFCPQMTMGNCSHVAKYNPCSVFPTNGHPMQRAFRSTPMYGSTSIFCHPTNDKEKTISRCGGTSSAASAARKLVRGTCGTNSLQGGRDEATSVTQTIFT